MPLFEVEQRRTIDIALGECLDVLRRVWTFEELSRHSRAQADSCALCPGIGDGSEHSSRKPLGQGQWLAGPVERLLWVTRRPAGIVVRCPLCLQNRTMA